MSNIMVDWGLTLGNAITILVLGAGGLGFIYALRGKLDSLSDSVDGMQTEMKKLVEILVQQGRHEERMNAIDGRVQQQGTRLDELTRRFNVKINGVHEE